MFSLKFRLVAEEWILQEERKKKHDYGENYKMSADLQEKYQWYKTKTGEEVLLEECPQHPDYTLHEKGGSTYDFNGTKIQSITETVAKYTKEVVPSFKFFTAHAQDFGDFTEKHLNRQLAIVYNNIITSSPVIMNRIPGEGIITGLTSEEVRELISIINFKNLKVLLDQKNQQNPNSFLFLKSLTTLSLEQAQVLSQFQGKAIFLNGLTQLDDSVAKALAPFRSKIYATEKITTQIGQHK